MSDTNPDVNVDVSDAAPKTGLSSGAIIAIIVVVIVVVIAVILGVIFGISGASSASGSGASGSGGGGGSGNSSSVSSSTQATFLQYLLSKTFTVQSSTLNPLSYTSFLLTANPSSGVAMSVLNGPGNVSENFATIGITDNPNLIELIKSDQITIENYTNLNNNGTVHVQRFVSGVVVWDMIIG